jgi:polyhydroxyalkanoate synthesis regulator phasin
VGKSELLKRSLEMGTSFIDMTRDRAELLVKELVDAGVVRKGQAEKAIDLVVERTKKRTELLGALIRREVSDQLAAFGVATKDDIARLEEKLGATAGGGRQAPSRVRSSTTKAAPIRKAAKAAGASPSAKRPTTATPPMKSQKRRRAGATPKPPEAR